MTDKKIVKEEGKTIFTFTRYFSHLSAETDLPIFRSNFT